MQSKFKWMKTAFGEKWRAMDYKERQEFEAWVSNKLDMLNDEMMNWQPSPKGDSIEEVLEIIEGAVTGELPDSLKPDEDKPKKRGKK